MEAMNPDYHRVRTFVLPAIEVDARRSQEMPCPEVDREAVNADVPVGPASY